MSEEKMYVGNGLKGKFESITVQLDLTELWEYTKGQAASKIREWKDKNGKIHKTINLIVAPMKEENCTQYKTHSVKIDTWEKTGNKKEESESDTPF